MPTLQANRTLEKTVMKSQFDSDAISQAGIVKTRE